MDQHDDQRVLILLASARDAQASAKTMALSGIHSVVCRDMDDLCNEIARGVGALLVGKELLQSEGLARFSQAMADQPSWSHLPIIVLLRSGEVLTAGDPPLQRLEPYGNVTLLEGPVRLGTLVSTVRASIAYRQRQYQQRDLLAQLEQSRQEAVDANRAKSDFLANMSHEIRTPLGAVLGFSELLMEPGTSERERQIYMTTIRRNGQLLSALIDDILDLAKVESGRIEVDSLEFSLNELLSEVVSVMEPQASRKELPLLLERSPRVPDMVRTDPIRLKQILMNLVGNAVKFTSYGSIQVRLDCVPVEDDPANRCQLEVEVEDSGIGIAPGQAQRLFQPFMQADTSTTRRFGGTGLGLVLSRQLARALGGDLFLKWSVPGGGSCFTLRLTLDVAPRRIADENNGGKHLSGSKGPLNGRRILVVDDSLDNQVLIGRTLKILGAQVELANDGLEAIHKAMANSFDVVLMDLQMPRLGGVEATRILREKGYTGPIVALTAHALKEDRIRCFSVGCTEYLTKPIQRRHLVQVLEKVAPPSQPSVG